MTKHFLPFVQCVSESQFVKCNVKLACCQQAIASILKMQKEYHYNIISKYISRCMPIFFFYLYELNFGNSNDFTFHKFRLLA